MTKTSTEELIRDIRRTKKSKQILVPRIEEFMRKAVEIEDDEDREFFQLLVKARSQPRQKGVYSPSMLANCVRQVYLVKKKTPHKKSERVSLNGYFLDGNFRHFKWQFLMWKMHRTGIIQLVDVGSICPGTEVPVHNQKGDFAGTIDNLIYIPDLDLITQLDWKGANSNGFNKAIANGVPSLQYILQSAGYAVLANGCLDLPQKIENILIIMEHKNGPLNTRLIKTPLGLSEFNIKISDYQMQVSQRIKKLRSYDRREELPPVECKSTRIQMFRDCPFSGVCRAEIERAERKSLRKNKNKIKDKPQVIFNKDR